MTDAAPAAEAPELAAAVAAAASSAASAVSANISQALEAAAAAAPQLTAAQLALVARHAGHDHPRRQREAGFILWATVAALVLSQAALVRCKRAYPRPYAAVTLFGLWAAPCVLAVLTRGFAFLALWAAFTACAGVLFVLARAKPLAKATPRRVYRWLDLTYRACLATASATWAALMVPLLLPAVLLLLPGGLPDAMLRSLAYSIYFGVLTRDVGELAAETMTANLSQRGGGGKREQEDESEGRAAARRLAAQYSCALCGDELRIVGEGSAVEAGGEEGGPADGDEDDLAHISEPVVVRARDGSLVLVMPGSAQALQLEAAARARLAAAAAAAKALAAAAASEGEAPQQQKVLAFKDARKPHGDRLYQLQCMHVFHEACIKGWCVIGKKDTCPTCSERVDIKALLKTSPLWGQTSRLWGQLLDAVRYVVVWNPLIFLALRLLFWEMGIGGTSGGVVVPSPGPLADPQQLALPLPGDAGGGAGGGGASG